jgi:transposase-like protein
MTLDQNNNNGLMLKLFEELNSNYSGGIRSLLEGILNAAMKLERENFINAKPYERNSERIGYANGYKDKILNTRMGTLDLQVPQVRGLSFYPQCIEKGSRSERALKLAVAEMYLKGVSTRKVDAITQELCGMNFTSTQVSRATKELDAEFEIFRNRMLGGFEYLFLDATYLKIRHNGMVIDQATLIAYGVNKEGKREIIGASTSLSEAEVHWREFLESLVKRGINGIKLIISDDHFGLRKARQKVFPSVPWQRCQFHMSKNAQSYASKQSLKEPIAQAMRDIFNSSDLRGARQKIDEISKKFIKIAPEFVEWLNNNIEEGLICFNFPRKHWIKIRTTNGLERVNREIKRRTRVAVLFPNAESALRLVTGVLIEIHEDWITDKIYLKMEEEKETKYQMVV